jgi:O-methyltransferase
MYATSALLANEIRSTERTLWLFDSFKGLGKPSEKDLLIDDIF